MAKIVSKETLRQDTDSEVPDLSEQEINEWRLLRPFIARCLTLNHEMAGPLAGILGYAEFLSTEVDYLTTDQKRYLDDIIECTESMCRRLERLGDHKADLSGKLDIVAWIEKYTEEP